MVKMGTSSPGIHSPSKGYSGKWLIGPVCRESPIKGIITSAVFHCGFMALQHDWESMCIALLVVMDCCLALTLSKNSSKSKSSLDLHTIRKYNNENVPEYTLQSILNPTQQCLYTLLLLCIYACFVIQHDMCSTIKPSQRERFEAYTILHQLWCY